MRRRCFVTGATSQIGSWLVPHLVETGWEPHVLSRGHDRHDYGAAVVWHPVDLSDRSSRIPAVEAGVLFHTAQIDLLPAWINCFRRHGVNRLIAFSTTSIVTKACSGTPSERELIARLARAECDVALRCPEVGINCTIFRPTLIYGGQFGDLNISEIARVIGRFGFFPVFAGAEGLRQPVHAADLAEACLQACDCVATFGRTYNLPGGETLSYRSMVERVFQSMGRKPRLVRLPAPLLSVAVRLARKHPRFRHINIGMARRMGQDMVFDCMVAANDFGFRPRKFVPVLRM